MRNERGFFTIVGLCLLLAVAISIRGVQEFEGNYSIGVTNVQAEFELQNFADSGIAQGIGDYTFHSDRLGTVKVDVRQLTDVSNHVINYIRTENGRRVESQNKVIEEIKACDILISVASCDNPSVGGKIYRRATAYVLEDGRVYLMNDQ